MPAQAANLWKVTYEQNSQKRQIHVVSNTNSSSLTADVADWLGFAVFTYVNQWSANPLQWNELSEKSFLEMTPEERQEKASKLVQVKILAAEYIGEVLS